MQEPEDAGTAKISKPTDRSSKRGHFKPIDPEATTEDEGEEDKAKAPPRLRRPAARKPDPKSVY